MRDSSLGIGSWSVAGSLGSAYSLQADNPRVQELPDLPVGGEAFARAGSEITNLVYNLQGSR